MSKINGDMEFDTPVNDTDAVNLKYFNEKLSEIDLKIEELKALITAFVTEFKNKEQIEKTSQLVNDSEFVTKHELINIQKEQLNKIIETL